MSPHLAPSVAPPANFLSSLSVFRRPQTPADIEGFELRELSQISLPGAGGPEPPFAKASVIDADYIRKVGSVFRESSEYLVPAQLELVSPMSSRCLRRLSVKARRRQLKLERADRTRGVVLLLVSSETSQQASYSYTQLIDGNINLTEGAFHGPLYEYGVVPDGVSTVTLLLENKSELSAHVANNFYSIAIPPPLQHGQAIPVWRDASGHTIKVLFPVPVGRAGDPHDLGLAGL